MSPPLETAETCVPCPWSGARRCWRSFSQSSRRAARSNSRTTSPAKVPSFSRPPASATWRGIVSKRATSPYRSGRGGDWVKTKCVLRQEFVIGGYRYSTRDPGRDLGSLLIGYHDRGKLIYAGSVGTGWSIQLGRSILAKLQRIGREASPFVAVPRPDAKDA